MTMPASIRLRVYPNDLDGNMHVNNGRYLTLMDLGRINLIIRSGIFRDVIKHKYAPTLASIQMRYRMQLVCFQPFDLETRVLCWDEKWIYMEQRFLFTQGPKAGAVAAIGLVKGGFYNPTTKTTVPTSSLMQSLGHTGTSPDFPAYIQDWVKAEESLKGVTA